MNIVNYWQVWNKHTRKNESKKATELKQTSENVLYCTLKGQYVRIGNLFDSYSFIQIRN